MSEPHLSNWDAVRDSLKIPTKNRYEAIHLTDQKIAKHLEVSAAALKQLYELYEIDDVYPGVKELRALIKQVAEKVSVPTPNTDVPRTGGLEIGGGHSQAEKENIHAVLDRERWALQTILDDIAAHANTHEARLSQLNELIAPNEAREKRELEAFKKQQAGAAAERRAGRDKGRQHDIGARHVQKKHRKKERAREHNTCGLSDILPGQEFLPEGAGGRKQNERYRHEPGEHPDYADREKCGSQRGKADKEVQIPKD